MKDLLKGTKVDRGYVHFGDVIVVTEDDRYLHLSMDLLVAMLNIFDLEVERKRTRTHVTSFSIKEG